MEVSEVELHVFLFLTLFMIWYICKVQLGWHPVAAVQYTFTHKQYIEQHNETEYTQQHIYNNKNTKTYQYKIHDLQN